MNQRPNPATPGNPSHGKPKHIALLAAVLAGLFLVSCGDDATTTANLARFCDINEELTQMADFTTAAADEARELVDRTRALLAEAEDTAPDEIRDAADATADSYRTILDFYAEADFEVDEQEFEAAIASGEIGTDPPEADLLFTWLDDNC